MSKVGHATERLESALFSLQSRRFHSMNRSEQRMLRAILHRMASDHISAGPSSLYRINSSILLTMLSLTVSYTIVLLQSK